MAEFGWVSENNPVLSQIDSASTRYGVDRNLAHVVAQMESNYNPNAVSGAGAQGTMQLMPATAQTLGVKNSFDSAQNVDGGVKLLGQLLRKYGGDTRLTLAAYNAGEGAVDRAHGVPDYPETQAYVRKGMSLLYPALATQPSTAAPTSSQDEFGWVPDPAAAPTPAAPPTPSLGEQFLQESIVNPAKQVASEAVSASAWTNRQIANASDVLHRLLPNAGFDTLRDWARNAQQTNEQQAEQLAGGRTDLASQIYRGIGGLARIPEYALGAEIGGPVLAMAGIGALTESDKGFMPAMQAAAEGALTGGALTVLGPASRPVRLTGAALMSYAQSRLKGADNATALANAMTMGGLAAIPGGGVTASEIFPRTAAAAAKTGEAATEAAGKTAAAATGAIKGGVSAIPSALVEGAKTAGYGVMGGPHGALTGFKIGFGRELSKGIAQGVKEQLAARAAGQTAAEAAPEAAAAAAAPAETAAAAAAPTGPVTGITDDALMQLYNVETDPVKRAAIRSEIVNRGLVGQPAAAAPAAPNPYANYSDLALRAQYNLEGNAFKRSLIEQEAQNRGVSLLSQAGRRATVTPPETGFAEPRGPSMTQEDAGVLRQLGIDPNDPALTSDDIRAARQLAAEPQAPPAPQLTAADLTQARTGIAPSRQTETEQGVSQSILDAANQYLRAPQTIPSARILPEQQAAGLFGSVLNPEAVPETPAAAPPVAPVPPAAPALTPEAPPAAEAPVAPLTRAERAADVARQLEASDRPERMTNFLKTGIKAAQLDKLSPGQWRDIAFAAGSPEGTVPTAADIAQVKTNLEQYERSQPQEIEKPATKAEAQAQFEEKAPARQVANRAAMAKRFADTLTKQGFTADQIEAIEPGRWNDTQIRAGAVPKWGNIADALGEAKEPSAATVREIIRQMRGQEPPTGPAAPAAPAAITQPETLTPETAEAQFQQKAQATPGEPGQAAETAASGGIVSRLDDAANAALDRIRQRGTFKGTQLNALVPADDLADMAIWGAAKIAKGTITFAKWSNEMIADAGEQIRPYLKDLYSKAQQIYGQHVQKTAGNLASTEQLLSLYRAGEEGKDWYKYTQAELENHFGDDAPLFVDFLAATSPNASVKANVALALKAYTQYKTGQPFEGYMPAVIGNLEKVSQGISPSGPKVTSFKANLFGNTEAVTVDRWIARAMGWPSDNLTPSQYKFLDYTITQVAKKTGVEPRQMQAAIWKAIKDAQGRAGDTGASFETLLNQKIATDPQLAGVIRELRARSVSPPPPQ